MKETAIKALVTGGGGFLGGALVAQLVSQGHRVRTLARKRYASLETLGVEQHQGTISDRDTVENAIRGCDIVFHVAAKTDAWGPLRDFELTNIVGTENVITACRAANVRTLVFTSSPSVVLDGSDAEGIDESAPYPMNYRSYYAQTKAQAEQIVVAANDTDLKTVSLRPHLIWGPGDTSIFPRLLSRAKAGRLRRIEGDPKLVDTTYIDDAVQAHLRAAQKLLQSSNDVQLIAGKSYFISSGTPIELWEMINRMLAVADLPPVTKTISPRTAHAIASSLEFTYRFFRLRGEPPLTRWIVEEMTSAHWFDIRAAQRDLGYVPHVTYDEGFSRFKTWYQSSFVS